MKKRCGLVFFVRHGQTDFNLERRFQGQLDIELNDVGKKQAERAGKFLAELFDPSPGKRGLILQEFSTSDLKRAHETALALFSEIQLKLSALSILKSPQPLAGITKTPLLKNPLLREIHVGMFAGHTFAEFEQRHPGPCNEYMRRFEVDPHGTAYPGGESASDVLRRMLEFYQPSGRELLDDHVLEEAWHIRSLWKNIPAEIIVGHGAALGILLTEILGYSKQSKPESLKLGNADCVVLGHFRTGAKILQHVKVE